MEISPIQGQNIFENKFEPSSSSINLENLETVVPAIPDSEDKKDTSYKLLNMAKISAIGLTSLMHLGAAGYHVLNNSSKREPADNIALSTSKIVLVSQCLLETYQALKKNRLVEAIARFIEPLFIVAEKRVEDLGLARGLGLGISQLVGSQEGIYNELAKETLGIDVKDKNAKSVTKGQDVDLNIMAMQKIFREIVDGGILSGRRFLTGLTLKNIREKLAEFASRFKISAFSEFTNPAHGDYRGRFNAFLKSSGLQSIKDLFKGNDKLDKGHTDAISGYLMILGSVLGYIGKANKNIFYKIGGTIRNLGGTVADMALFGHPEPDFNISAMFLTVNTFMDIVQRFIPAKWLNVILPWSNFSMAAYNVGVGLYLNRSSKKSNEGEKIQYHDTDLHLRESKVARLHQDTRVKQVNSSQRAMAA